MAKSGRTKKKLTNSSTSEKPERRKKWIRADTSMIEKTTLSLKKEPSKKVLPEPRPDPEDVAALDDEEEFDFSDWKGDGAHPFKLYPPPKKNNIFRKKWKEYIENISARANFNRGHLSQLEILCDLYVEYAELSKFVRVNGYTYEAFGRQGKAIKPYPQVLQMNRVLSEIRNYSKALGMLIKKDETEGKSEGLGWD